MLFVKYCRVGASDHIGELTGAEVVCMLVGERPGLVTAESMSAYLTYKPYIGIPESKRTVVSNIHKQGTTAVEAGAHIAELIKTMLEKKASGIDFTNYKRTTVMRRIERRMVITHRVSLSDYVKMLGENLEEGNILAKEILIGVTNFFPGRCLF